MLLVNPFVSIVHSIAILQVYYGLFLPLPLHPSDARQVNKFPVEVRSMQPAILFSDYERLGKYRFTGLAIGVRVPLNRPGASPASN